MIVQNIMRNIIQRPRTHAYKINKGTVIYPHQGTGSTAPGAGGPLSAAAVKTASRYRGVSRII
jgi:hypothetical protein